MDTTTGTEMTRKYLAKVGFPVESRFSANGLTKLEFHNIKIEAQCLQHAKKRLTEGYGSDIMIVSVKYVGEI